MNHTKELLLKIKAAVLDGRLSGENIPIADIKQCVASEIEVNRSTFTEEQYSEVLTGFLTLCEGVPDDEQDKNRIVLLLDALILSVDMISHAVHTLANGEYWRYKHRDKVNDPEVMEIIEYIEKEHKIGLISYNFTKEYDALPVEVCLDSSCQMRYVPYKNRKMFFPRSWDEQKIADYYRGVVREQDARSPHCYASTTLGEVAQSDVVVDAGAAEGIFALDVIDKARKIYLVEADPEWMEALEQTFRDDGEKVQLIYGFLDSIHEGNHVSIDGLFEQEDINFIKMDIEGFEKPALSGAVRTLQRCKNIRCAICAYHCREDEEWLRSTLERYGFETEVSKGYMCPDWTLEAYLDAELRRGIVFGRKNHE